MKKLLTTTALSLLLAVPGIAIAETITKTESGAAIEKKNTDGTTVKMSTDEDSTKVTVSKDGEATDNKDESKNVAASEDQNKDEMKAAATEGEKKEMVHGKPEQAASWVSRPGPATYLETPQDGQIYASKLIGMRVYAVERDVDEGEFYNESARSDWEDIGEVNDIIVGWNGDVQAVVLGVGGFLGIGEKDVAVDIASLRRVREKDDADDWFLVVNSTKEQLENAPMYKRAM